MTDELERIRARATALADQVKLLVRTEQRLSLAQRALEEQVRRIEIVNRLSLTTAAADAVEQVLDFALEALLSTFPFEQAVAFVPRTGGVSPFLARSSSEPTELARRTTVPRSAVPDRPTLAPPLDGAPWLFSIDEALPEVPRDDRAPRRLIVIPVHGGMVLAACTFGAPTSHARPLPQPEDQPFLELFARHTSAALEALALRRRTVESETLFQTAFAHAMSGMALVDEEGRFALVNRALATMLGMTEGQLSGRKVAELTHPDDRVRTRDALVRGVGDPSFRGFDMEKRYLRSDGTTLWARTAGSRVEPTPTRPGYWFVQIVDVTERRSLEETERLATVGRLAAGVAHEINNPLTYVLFELELLGRARLEGRPAQSVENALAGSRRIARIVRDLKTFARASGEESLEPVDLSRVVEVVLEMCTAEVRHRAQIALKLSAGVVVRATEARIAQVLMNLVINAAHAIGEGNVERDEIEVRSWVEDEFAHVSVRDTGGGIAPEDQRRIFEPFFTTKGPGVGSGLGLSISSAIVESYGGTLTFTSELGKGSSFLVRLPAYQGDRLSSRKLAVAPRASVRETRPRVLLIDDEPMVLRSLALSLDDCEVFAAEGASAARDLIARHGRFDAVVCDLMMPGESGSELYGWLCDAHPELARRTIFITGGAFTPRAQALVADVTNTVLEKPFELERLRALIHDLHLTDPSSQRDPGPVPTPR